MLSTTTARFVARRSLRHLSSTTIGEHRIKLQNEALSTELEEKANRRFYELTKEHRALPSDDESRRKRLVYRSKQRGWLEVDLLLGIFSERISTFSDQDLDEYEAILNCETIDIFNFVTGKDEVPESLNTPMMKTLQEYCRNNPIGTGREAYAYAKTKSNLI